MNDDLQKKVLIARAEDTIELSKKQYSAKCFGFLTPSEASTIRRIFKEGPLDGEISLRFFGGYAEAERCLFLAFPEYAEETVNEEFISLLEITARDIQNLSHRDFLGSILGLGIRREKIGDIICLEDRCLVFAMSDITDYIASNLLKVANCGVKIREVEIRDIKIPMRSFQKIKTTVASLRLDAVIGAAIKTSRAKALEVIHAGRVLVNWNEALDPSAKMSPGDVFSIRGMGRFRLSEETSETRKGRISICIEKAI